MSKFVRLGAVASLMAIASAISTPAVAATKAGNLITNTVKVNYKVGTVAQPEIEAQNQFTVDRKVDLLVQNVGTATIVSPSATQQVTTFDVNNQTNDEMDIALSATNRTGDDFDVTNVRIYRDNTAGTPLEIGVFDAGDQLITYLDNVAAETNNIRVFVVADIPDQTSLPTPAGNKAATVRLTGTARDAGAVGSLGSAITVATANSSGKDSVFADLSTANGNSVRDGIHFADGTYRIGLLGVVKSSRVITTTLNGVPNSLAIPGATVEYCIAITNPASTAVNTVDISDVLPTETTFDSAFGVKVDGTMTGSDCNAGSTAGSYDTGTRTVTGTIPTVASGSPRNVLFRVTIN